MKVKLVRVFRWIIFCSIIIFFLYSMTPYYAKRKGADYNYQTIQEMRENPEVLVFGSSYSELAFMPNELYKNYGITSYNLSAPSQRLDTSYYVIESIIQEKNPKVIIMVTDYINEISRKSTLNEEILSIRDLNGNEIKKWKYLYSHFGFQTMEYIKFHFPILQFHQDLLTGDLKIDDLKQNKHLKKLYQKGYSYYYDTVSVNIPRTHGNEELDKDAVEYTRNMIELCKEKGIQVVFITIPTQDEFLYSESIKRNFPDCGYIDFYDLMDEIELDENEDFMNYYHVNDKGAVKITNYIGEYLQDNYDLIDHRKLQENNLWDITLPVLEWMGYDKYDDKEWANALELAGYSTF